MPRYRRSYIPGGTFFFTVNLLDRNLSLLTDYVNVLREVFMEVQRRRPFKIEAMVILPDHLHCLWTLPPGDADFSGRWQVIKARFAARLPKGERLSPRRLRKGERGIWQRRFWEHAIRDEDDYALHVDYIHFNPVKHGLIIKVADWPYSSFHRFVAQGLYPPDWAAPVTIKNLDMELILLINNGFYGWCTPPLTAGGRGSRDGGMRFAFPPYGLVGRVGREHPADPYRRPR